ncbi:MAG: multifunctional CCA addition/repair protein [Burkholderiaceae bacterium]|nr:multifunctional CCA addition/repair protein [Burkholderiaceae bacterium]
MEIYEVGGCLRDELLGLAVKDRDWVVVGATVQQMLEAGFKPVGKDFPVFLHPKTHEEYALARTERKTAAGYHGFVFHADPSVTLVEDLARRDFTVNALARDPQGRLIDPFGGQDDLAGGIFRHVSPAFAEDPVRILRLARFMARFENFTVAPETLALCRQMVAAGEVDALVAERVWQELSRGLMEPKPSRMLRTLLECGALQRLLPELAALQAVELAAASGTVDLLTHITQVLDRAAQVQAPLAVRFALMMQGLSHAYLLQLKISSVCFDSQLLRGVCKRLRVPAECRDLAILLAKEVGHIHACLSADATSIVQLLERCDALRKPERFAQLLQACTLQAQVIEAFAPTEAGQRQPYRPAAHLQAALQAIGGVNTGAIAARHVGQPQLIKQAIHAARVACVQETLER